MSRCEKILKMENLEVGAVIELFDNGRSVDEGEVETLVLGKDLAPQELEFTSTTFKDKVFRLAYFPACGGWQFIPSGDQGELRFNRHSPVFNLKVVELA